MIGTIYIIGVLLTWIGIGFALGFDKDNEYTYKVFSHGDAVGFLCFLFGLVWFLVLPIGGAIYGGWRYRTRLETIKDEDRELLAYAADEFLQEMKHMRPMESNAELAKANTLHNALRSWSQKYE